MAIKASDNARFYKNENGPAIGTLSRKVVANVNVTLAWLLGNVEPYVDAFTVGYDTYTDAVLDVMLGNFAPVGKLPITFPRGDELLEMEVEE